MEYTKLKFINEYRSESINPMKYPDTVFELYSVPAFDTGHPELIHGADIGSNKVIVQKNDILLCKINPRINRVWVVADETEHQCIASSEWIVIRNNSNNPEYLAWYFRCPIFKKLMTSEVTGIGGSLTRAQPKAVAEYSVPIPSIEQQNDVVSVLRTIHSIIHLRKTELDYLDNLIKARFVEMFGNAAMFPFEPLNNNVLEMFIGPFGSALKNECFVAPEEGYCIVYEQKHAIQKTMDVPTRYVDKEKYLELKRFSVYPGDIIVSCRGTIGEIFVVPEGAPLGIMHPSIMKIRLNTDIYDQSFFVLALEQYMEEHNNEAKGSGVKMAVTATTLGKELFVVPPLNVQKQFSAFVAQINKSKL